MEVIQQWLDSGVDYNKGVDIYKNTKGCSKILLRQFALREILKKKLLDKINSFYFQKT